jgi:hypothetical protein
MAREPSKQHGRRVRPRVGRRLLLGQGQHPRASPQARAAMQSKALGQGAPEQRPAVLEPGGVPAAHAKQYVRVIPKPAPPTPITG